MRSGTRRSKKGSRARASASCTARRPLFDPAWPRLACLWNFRHLKSFSRTISGAFDNDGSHIFFNCHNAGFLYSSRRRSKLNSNKLHSGRSDHTSKTPSVLKFAEKFDLATRAAWLYYVAGNTQNEIAEKLQISRPVAQRLVAFAVEKNLIRVRVEHRIADCLSLAKQFVRPLRGDGALSAR